MKKDYKNIKLFGKKGDIVKLKHDLTLIDGSIINKGDEFIIDDIIDLGFNLASTKDNIVEYRFINSSMFKYFEKVEDK